MSGTGWGTRRGFLDETTDFFFIHLYRVFATVVDTNVRRDATHVPATFRGS